MPCWAGCNSSRFETWQEETLPSSGSRRHEERDTYIGEASTRELWQLVVLLPYCSYGITIAHNKRGKSI